MATKLQEELAAIYRRNGFGDVIGSRSPTVPVYTGCMLVPLPDIETRRRYLKYHDVHHLVTGYNVGRIGEGEVSAWELGTGSALVSPTRWPSAPWSLRAMPPQRQPFMP